MVKFLSVFLIVCSLFGNNLNKLCAQPLFSISEVQGPGNDSPLLEQLIRLENVIVTARGNGFFVLQAPAAQYDNNALTSEAIIVTDAFFGQPGDVVDVTGTVYEEDGMTVLANPGLSISNTGENLPLPAPVLLTEDLPSSERTAVHSLERVEGMRVHFEAIANGPSTSFEDVPLRIGGERLFREPGIEAPGIMGLPEWDGNPELFWMDPNGLSAPNDRFINTGSTITATGILIEAAPGFWLVLAESYSVTTGPEAAAVRDKANQEFTVGSLNALFLLEDEDNIDVRYQKVARYIDQQMKLPDFLALQEVGSITALNNLAYYLEQQNPEARYDAYLLPTDRDLKLGYLVKEHFTDVQVTQLGANEVFTFNGGLLHDRPPLLLQVQLPTEPALTLQVLNLHIRSLIGIEGSAAGFVRNKRHQQAISIAQMVDDLQENGNLVVVGDFNAFQFTDGYVDVFNQITGRSTLGAQFSPLPIVDPPLDNQLSSLPVMQRYSYIFRGNAQSLDHCLTGNLIGLTANGMAYARGNADFSVAYELATGNPLSASDHDGLVLYLESDFPIRNRNVASPADIQLQAPAPLWPGAAIQIVSTAPLGHSRLFSMTGQLVTSWAASGYQAALTWPDLPAGPYFLQVSSEEGVRNFKLVAR